ncbi:NAD-dependent nucleoside-diphosphate-sugar epimerase protein (plasmid) [Rhizobium etli 8C-3]|uniref:Uncharacterized protein YbjT (DUF2867 family) n=2 Tax=Rhizobium TaxID=379 RepID=A0A4R3RI66_9HYPH|nr:MULTISPECIES: SDR family oxidoreductase [Rhizobium]APO78079.1 NAD-dependent nucleoside-diphosphate-sugar epimerase protein [Rhizobium etli 8C-3]TCU31036.1 uncharacterized protein YbjT (DUF2867 family) [Rhizobium azibense]TCU40942.1 uncharacterized protein YbjT (DUF2867 family) [Rhizobium azibense]
MELTDPADSRRTILVIGATGLIGSAIAVRLRREGHSVTGLARTWRRSGAIQNMRFDVALATKPEDWLHVLSGVEVAVNCAGALQDGPGDDVKAVHFDGPSALFKACERAGVKRLIHLSAIGVDRAQPSDFSNTKYRAEEALKASALDWVILRPSVVLGRAAYGASAMFRGLAALPILPLMPDTGKLQVVELDDVVETVVRLLPDSAPARVTLDLAGPEPLEFGEVVAAYRSWMGRKPAHELPLPRPVSKILYGLGDLAGWLGWRPPLRTTAAREIVRGATGDPTRWIKVTGITPTSLSDALAAYPISVQERWFSGLYFLKPIALLVLAAFWIATGIISLTVGWGLGVDLMRRTALPALAEISVVAGAFADLVVGALIAFRRTSHAGLLLGVAISLFYVAAGTLLLPELWREPLGPLLKIWPILVLHLITIVILEDR